MPNGGTAHTRTDRNWDRAHSDINVLAQRVTGIESALVGFGSQLQDIRKQLESKPTDVWKIIGGVVTVISLIGGFLLVGKQPYDEGLARHDREIGHLVDTAVNRTDYLRDREGEAEWNRNLRDRLRADEDNGVTQRQISELKERIDERYRITEKSNDEKIVRVEKHIDSIDEQLIKRPEINSIVSGLDGRVNSVNTTLDNRINSVILGLNELRHDFGANFTMGDALKGALDRLDKLQLQISALAQLPAPQAPTPAAPPR